MARLSSLLVLLFIFNLLTSAAWDGSIGRKAPEREVLISPTGINSSPQDVKSAVLQGITSYLNQFEGTCFRKAISIGDPAKFTAAIGKSMNRIIVGAEGQKMIKEKSPNAQSFHYTYKLIGMTADMVFPFDPGTIDPGEDGYKNRQTMMHEMTHHIEWLNGVKESSKDAWGNKNPRSELNTDYQDGVVDILKNLVALEDLLKSKKSTMGILISRWQGIESRLRELETGSAAGKHLPKAAEEALRW